MRIEAEEVKKKREEEEEKAKASLDTQEVGVKTLSPTGKLRYIWDYYKLPIFILFLFLFIGFSFLHRKLTAKEPLLYVGVVNINLGDELPDVFTKDYLAQREVDAKKTQLVLNQGLYLTDDTSSEAFSYSYASRIKILSSIDAGTLDVVLFDKEAFDAFAQNGFLYDLSTLPLKQELLVENIAIEEEVKEKEEAEEQEEKKEEKKREEKEEQEEKEKQEEEKE
ncbi:MAG: hypothetical protein IIZ39_08800, partial [Blautia sp.]|nr:hypothetical protein [Blautia sp.]